jgi:hypothetical protein
MTASDHLTPEQFGFITHDTIDKDPFPWPIEREGGWSSKMLSVSTPLHTRQGHLDPAVVERYKTGAGSGGRKDPPEVVRYQGEHLMLNGHHRMAAARLKGQKRLKVNFKDIDENGETK